MMKIVHISAVEPQVKPPKKTAKQEREEMMHVLANRLRNSRSANQEARRILEIELNED